MNTLTRCEWCLPHQLYMDYHDREWGIPNHDDRHLFEMLILEGAQAGLSWYTILQKREGYRLAFDNFDAEKVAHYDEQKVQELLQNSAIVRNQLKVRTAITNAQAYLRVIETANSFDEYIWQFVDHQPIINRPLQLTDVPVKTAASDAMSRHLKQQGFKFVGSTICYAFMQAVGMVDDHVESCWRKKSS